MAKKAVELDQNSFLGHYYLVIHSSGNIIRPTAGSGPALHKSDDLAVSIVYSAFNLIGKGLTLGATAAGAGVTRNTYNSHVGNMMNAFRFAMESPKPSALNFLIMVPKIFNVAEYSEANGFGGWRDLYSTVCGVEIEKLAYSDIDPERLDEAKEQVMELYIIADAKV